MMAIGFIIINILLKISNINCKTAEDLAKAREIGNEIKRSFNDAEKIIDDKLATKNELIKQRDLIIAKLSAKTKEFRKLHDIIHPELKEHPIILVKKGKVDAERYAISSGLRKGLKDSLYGLHSPCERLFKTRRSEQSELKKLGDKFATEQETMDLMPIDQRLNYDEHMIKHWTEVVKELEEDISTIYNSV